MSCGDAYAVYSDGTSKGAVMEKDVVTRWVLRVLWAGAWAACGAALLLVPALGEVALNASLRLADVSLAPSVTFYLWTNALPLGLVVAALAHAFSGRLMAHRRRVLIAASVVLLAYFGVCAVWFAGDFALVARVRWAKAPLRYAAWCLWGALLPLWVLAAPENRRDAASSPLDDLSGVERLTEREREIVELLLTGCTAAQAGEALGISASSVGTYRARACEKLGLASIDELLPPEPGSAAPSRSFDVTSLAAWPLAVMALCVGLILACLPRVSSLSSPSGSLGVVVVFGTLVAPWVVLVAGARFQDLRVRARLVTGRLGLVLLSLVLLGLLVGARDAQLELNGHLMVSANLVAMPVYVACVAWLAPYLLWPCAREACELDEARCVLYLRGRGAGELQARVLTEVALGRSAPEICEALHVARGTVNAYRAQGYELLGVHSSKELEGLLARDVGRVPSAGKKAPPAEDSATSE